MKILDNIIDKRTKREKQFAILIDPDKSSDKKIVELLKSIKNISIDFLFIGGSFITKDCFHNCVKIIKENCDKRLVIFPGNVIQIDNNADAILFLSLISGRNPEMLIGNHVIAAPYLKKSALEIIPTGYIIIDSGQATTVSYMSNTFPIPYNKNDIAAFTALAGEMLGMKLIYLDAGSGADKSISTAMINSVKSNINIPIIVGGGIKTALQTKEIYKAGADIVVVGNAFEKSLKLIPQIAEVAVSFK